LSVHKWTLTAASRIDHFCISAWLTVGLQSGSHMERRLLWRSQHAIEQPVIEKVPEHAKTASHRSPDQHSDLCAFGLQSCPTPDFGFRWSKKEAPKCLSIALLLRYGLHPDEITFVNYVRDRKDAQVHVLVTTQSTGSGGTEYTLTFSGQDQFKGIDNVLKYVSNKTDTDAEIRTGLAGSLKSGWCHTQVKLRSQSGFLFPTKTRSSLLP